MATWGNLHVAMGIERVVSSVGTTSTPGGGSHHHVLAILECGGGGAVSVQGIRGVEHPLLFVPLAGDALLHACQPIVLSVNQEGLVGKGFLQD